MKKYISKFKKFFETLKNFLKEINRKFFKAWSFIKKPSKKKKTKEFTLNGSKSPANIERRISLLTELMRHADQQSFHISELRQKNLNYALFIFAGLFTFNMKFRPEINSFLISFALFVIMIVFCILDRRYHRHIHGWRRTKMEFVNRINDIINAPSRAVVYRRYWNVGEKTAEPVAPIPVIYYFLILGAIFSFFV